MIGGSFSVQGIYRIYCHPTDQAVVKGGSRSDYRGLPGSRGLPWTRLIDLKPYSSLIIGKHHNKMGRPKGTGRTFGKSDKNWSGKSSSYDSEKGSKKGNRDSWYENSDGWSSRDDYSSSKKGAKGRGKTGKTGKQSKEEEERRQKQEDMHREAEAKDRESRRREAEARGKALSLIHI